MRRNAPLLLVCLLMAGIATAAPNPPARVDQMQKQVKSVEKNLAAERAKQEALQRAQEKLNAEIEKLQQDLVSTAQRTQAQEEALSQLEDSLSDLETREQQAIDDLQRHHHSMGDTLAALLRLQRQPPQALLAIPQTPMETAHSVVLLRAMLPELQHRVITLQNELASINKITISINERKTELADRNSKLLAEQKQLNRLVTTRQRKQTQNQQAMAAQKAKIDQLANEAQDLRDLIQKLASESRKRQKAAQKRPTAKPKGEVGAIAGVPLPARGKIITNFGEKNDLGSTSKGLLIETRPNAQVVSPYGGEIVYAGKFRSYGLILIIEVGEQQHIMLSNLGRIDGSLGQNVMAGEPVGTMPEGPKSPRLYVEYRSAGQPVSPRAWAAANS